jgi:hypothetical protein
MYRKPEPSCGKASPVQKGLIPSFVKGSADLCEEGLGFGVPILQYKRDFFFPGTADVAIDGHVTEKKSWKRFVFDLIERPKQRNKDGIAPFSWIYQRIYNRMYKSSQGRLLIELGSRTGLNRRRALSPTVPDFLPVESSGEVIVTYSLGRGFGAVFVELDLRKIKRDGLQHVYVSNELGGNHFTQYADSSGLRLNASDIGGWDRIRANWAVFFAPGLGLGFRVEIPRGVKAFRGREVIGSDISWSGVIFELPPDLDTFRYSVSMGDKQTLRRLSTG